MQAFEVVGTIKKVDAAKSVLYVFANGQDRTVKIAKDAKILDKEGKDLKDGLRSKELKEGAEVTLTVERMDGGPVIKAIRLGKHAPAAAPVQAGKESVGLKPLTEMTAQDKYKGEDGGLYGNGKEGKCLLNPRSMLADIMSLHDHHKAIFGRDFLDGFTPGRDVERRLRIRCVGRVTEFLSHFVGLKRQFAGLSQGSLVPCPTPGVYPSRLDRRTVPASRRDEETSGGRALPLSIWTPSRRGPTIPFP